MIQRTARSLRKMSEYISRKEAIALWDKYRSTIAVDAIEYDAELRKLPSAQLGTNLAEVGTDLAQKTVKGYPIDADGLLEKVTDEYGIMARDRLYRIIRNMPKYKFPPADVVQVVRCENCVHWSDSNQCARPELSGSRWHDAKYFETMPDDFCSYGERRED